MKMLDDGGDSFHAWRESYSYLSDIEWSAVERMSSTVGEHAVWAVLSGLDRDQQHSAVAKFIQNELDAALEKLALSSQQLSRQAELLREQGAQQTEQLSQQQAQSAVPRPMHAHQPEILEIDVSKFKAVKKDCLLLWLVELDRAIKARRIECDAMKVIFATSNLGGLAKAWALGLEMSDPFVFGSYENFKARLIQRFDPIPAENRARFEFLDLKQGTRDISAYSRHMWDLAHRVVCNRIDQQTQIAVFIKGLADVPIKTRLFRQKLETLDQAISMAKHEDYILRQSQASSTSYRSQRRQKSGRRASVNLVNDESKRHLSHDHKRLQRCNRCQMLGHYAYKCSAPHPVFWNTER